MKDRPAPDADVFLDDVTVSRDHALMNHRGDQPGISTIAGR